MEGAARTDAVDNALLIIRASALGSETEMIRMIGDSARGMSFGRKVGLLATFLASFNDNHDDARAAGGPRSGGSVYLKNMLDAIQANLATGTPIDAGVCRDMHQGAALLARAMGICGRGRTRFPPNRHFSCRLGCQVRFVKPLRQTHRCLTQWFNESYLAPS